MSKEKDLLVHALDRLKYINFEDDHLTNELIQKIEELLSQPQQEDPVPVGYLYKHMDCYGVWETVIKIDKPYVTWHNVKDVVPVYTSPQKREPLSDELLTTKNENETVAWMLIDKETGARIPRAYKPENVDEDRWELYPLYISPPKHEKFDINKVLDL